jgi:hypothetical protein
MNDFGVQPGKYNEAMVGNNAIFNTRKFNMKRLIMFKFS